MKHVDGGEEPRAHADGGEESRARADGGVRGEEPRARPDVGEQPRARCGCDIGLAPRLLQLFVLLVVPLPD